MRRADPALGSRGTKTGRRLIAKGEPHTGSHQQNEKHAEQDEQDPVRALDRRTARFAVECHDRTLREWTVATRLITVGHGTLSEDSFVELLRAAELQALVDVRTAPGSRRHPQFRRQAMEQWVPAHAIAYRWEPRLGGLRTPAAESPNIALRNRGFRAYADHMATAEFVHALDEVLDAAAARPTTVMCAETLWWRCHRRLIADFAALVRGAEVRHLMHDGRLVEHQPTAGVRREGDRLVYDVGQTGSLLT
ncbi:MAG: DUF488 domain-containing protein, partial [Acidimicrobiia bacterium]|nr:DUF488 domain-containing protein [Acidimicrobiia bacterium]